MPRSKMRPLLLLASLVFLYHWAFGLPSWLPGLQSGRPAQVSFRSPQDGYDIGKPWKKRVVAIGGDGYLRPPPSMAMLTFPDRPTR